MKVTRGFLILLLLVGISFAQETDSLRFRNPRKAAYRALAFPGGGQFYNHKFLKGVFIIGIESLAIWRWSVNRNNYKNYSSTMALPKRRYLEKRNKYAWWMGFIYIYGLLDAVVDAHLEPFETVMEEDLEQPPKEK
ncbi:MAG: DUF5683 domain-containing protein [Fidelibacterota bacterium]